MRSIYSRVFVTTLYTIAISSFLGFYAANIYYHWQLKPHNDAKLFRTAEMIRSFIDKNPDTMGDYLHDAATMGYQIYLSDQAGNDLFYGGKFSKLDLSESVKERVLAGGDYHGVAEYPNNPFKTSYFDNRLSNTVGITLKAGSEQYALFLRHDTRLQFDELQRFFALMFVFTVLFSIPYFLVSTRYLVQPITRLTEATKRLAQGDFNLLLPTSRRDEIGQLASNFAKMAQQLERSDKAKQEFVANVSHEIQSPLASIQGFADSLLRDDVDEKQIRHYAAVIGQESRQLSALSVQLLLLSTLDHTADVINKKHYPLQQQIRQAIQLLEWRIRDKEIAVHMHVSRTLQIYGDEVLLMQIWSNLLTNAVNHIPSGRSIDIKAYFDMDQSVVEISDTGDGIPEDSLPYIFDRFYRGDAARQRGGGSTGLGLAIVQKIVFLHGGTIEAESREGQGTRFRTIIPG